MQLSIVSGDKPLNASVKLSLSGIHRWHYYRTHAQHATSYQCPMIFKHDIVRLRLGSGCEYDNAEGMGRVENQASRETWLLVLTSALPPRTHTYLISIKTGQYVKLSHATGRIRNLPPISHVFLLTFWPCSRTKGPGPLLSPLMTQHDAEDMFR